MRSCETQTPVASSESWHLTVLQHVIRHQGSQTRVTEHHGTDGMGGACNGEASLRHLVPEPDREKMGGDLEQQSHVLES